MARQIGTWLAALVVLLIAGCPAPPGDGGAGLVAGTYAGNVTSTITVHLNGEQADFTQASLALTETLSGEGVPLLGSGEPIQQGDTLILAEAGENLLLGGVDSIQVNGDTTTLNLSLSGMIDGINVSGTGQIVYTALSSTSLQFNLTLTYSGTTATGDVLLQQETQQGTLSQ